MSTYDVVSDLHVDFWDKDYAYDWKKNKSDDCAGVIIVGDIADTLDRTVEELNKACDVYDLVLYVDGNHESTHHYDDLSYVSKTVSLAMESRENFINLTNTDYIDGKTVIIGACAWWDFRMCEPEISFEEGVKSMNCDWNPNKSVDRETIIQNIIDRANTDFKYIENKIKLYKDTYNICVVTHTIPHKDLVSDQYPFDQRYAPHYGNSLFQTFFEEDSVKYFLYGHNHDANGLKYVNKKCCISNPRGRPQDYNRKEYSPMRVTFT